MMTGVQTRKWQEHKGAFQRRVQSFSWAAESQCLAETLHYSYDSYRMCPVKLLISSQRRQVGLSISAKRVDLPGVAQKWAQREKLVSQRTHRWVFCYMSHKWFDLHIGGNLELYAEYLYYQKQIRASPRALLTSLSVCLDEHGIRRLALLEGLFFWWGRRWSPDCLLLFKSW